MRSNITGTVDIKVVPAQMSVLSFAGNMELSASRDWLTADVRSRITAVAQGATGVPMMAGQAVTFSLVGNNGSVRAI